MRAADLGEGMSKTVTMLDHIEELRKRLAYCIITIGIIAAFSFAFRLERTTINGYVIYYPYPDPFNNLTMQVLELLKGSLLPEGVKIIVTEPAEAFYALFYISIFLGILFGMPVIAYHLARFIAPGLHHHEKKMIFKLLAPSIGLFVAGCVFAYYMTIPVMLNFLYRYGFAVEAETFLTIDSFMSFIVLFMLAFGLCFQLPIIMVGLSALEVVDARFWRENWRYAVMAMAVFGAVITPDGSGISMFLVAGPMILLYGLGYLIVRRKNKVK